MIISRSIVDAALLSLLNGVKWQQGSPSVLTTWTKPASMHWQDWSNTTNQPCLYLRRSRENATQVLRGQNKYIMKYELWVYAQFESSNENVNPYSSLINPIMDALDAAINPTVDSDYQSLGIPHGVANARWNGDADVCDGSVDGQVCLVIPIEVWVSA